VVAAARVLKGYSQRAIARRLGVHRSFLTRWLKRDAQTGSVGDQRTKVQSSKGGTEMVQEVVKLVQEKPSSSLRQLAATLTAKYGRVSYGTVRRRLKAAGMVSGRARKVPLLTASHKERRVKFSRKHLNTLKTPWASVMVSDSKIFLLNSARTSSGTRCWYWRAARPTEPVVQKSQGVHVYLGVTMTGVTRPVFVTGAGGQLSPYDNPSTKGKHRGCCAREYCEKVLPALISDGDKLFAGSERWRKSWIFQQDGAKPHTAKVTKDLLAALMPGRVMSDWPACSPDLSWIENLWSWCDARLRERSSSIRSLDELRSAVQEVIGSISTDMLKNYVKGMPARLQKCIQLDGANIGK
jgi:transposase